MKVEESLGEKARRMVPFGVLVPDKPRHYREMMRIAWRNKHEAGYAMRILKHGVCDGCSLGPRGLKDDVMDGTHLCLTRLNLLELNTLPAMEDGVWEDVERLRGMDQAELQKLGRVPYPLVRRKGEKGFTRVSWSEALDLVAGALRDAAPDRLGLFATSRGLTNETYYAAQKLTRALGSQNVDLCARLCHSPSVEALKDTTGWSAMTCSLKDFIGAEVIVLVGTNLANNQPVSTKYLDLAKKAGTRIVVVNAYAEPGLKRYWVPSTPKSALFGTKLADEFYQVKVGGDVAFFTGVLKALIAKGLVREEWIRERTVGWEDVVAHVEKFDWPTLEEGSGLPRAEMEAFADSYGAADTGIIVWSMGITQHENGTDNVKALVNLALARGNIGRPHTGVVPIRGHSGVQGGGECGVDPYRFPGGADVNAENAAHYAKLWGVDVSPEPGLFTSEMMEAAHAGALDVLYSIGGNLYETLPDSRFVKEALERVKVRVHQDIVFNTSTLLDAEEAVVVLPGTTRYEQRGGGTTTTTERRIRFTPEIPGRRIGEAMSEWEILREVGKRAVGKHAFDWPDGKTLRVEMERAMPLYEGITKLEKEGDWIQWGGPLLGVDGFPKLPGNRARFSVIDVPDNTIPEGLFQVSTRRGKQFNSIIQAKKDPFTRNADRDAVLMHRADAESLGLASGTRVVLTNEHGEMRGRVRYADLPRRHVQVFWPEGNQLLPRDRFDGPSHMPDYNAFARVEPLA